jgi:hypothetical protein
MRLPLALASFLYLLVSQSSHVSAGPVPPEDEVQNNLDWIKHIFDRQAACAGVYCGVSSQYCCVGGQACYTDSNTVARCGAPTAAPAANNGWQYFTTTYVRTDLVTVVSTYSTYIAPVATVTVPTLIQSTAICNPQNQQGCGAICCNLAVETCAVAGRCTSYGAMTVPVTTTYSAPLRPTSNGVTTITAVVTPTTTQPFQTASTAGASSPATPLSATTSNPGLSPGAIAGIVIGVLAGIIILITICFCCILKKGLDGLLDLFGLRNKRRRSERVEVTEERYSRHGSASRRETHGGWFGGGGKKSTRVTEKKSSGLAKEGGILAGLALGLAGLWALLGMRRKKQVARPPRSDVSYGTYSDSYSGTGTSDSEFSPSSEFHNRKPDSRRANEMIGSASSDRRTRDTRRTRETRESRRVTSRPR